MGLLKSIFSIGGIVELRWYKYNRLHRINDKPAIIYFEGIDKEQVFKIKNIDDIHRLAGKIQILKYYKKGFLYRKDYTQPVRIVGQDIGGDNEKIYEAEWFKDGCRHREGGPAKIIGKRKEWYFEGNRHSLHGPAVTDHHPSLNEWWIHGRRLKMKEVRPWLRSNKVDLSTEAGRLAFYMTWGFE